MARFAGFIRFAGLLYGCECLTFGIFTPLATGYLSLKLGSDRMHVTERPVCSVSNTSKGVNVLMLLVG